MKPSPIALKMIDTTCPDKAGAIANALTVAFPKHLLQLIARAGTRIRTCERFSDAPKSSALYRDGSIERLDSRTNPAAGLFILADRTVYLRKTDPFTAVHETAHALDCALGRGDYLSSLDPRIRKAFANATEFVSLYSASGRDEYFAEGVRVFTGTPSDGHPLFPPVSRERFATLDSALYAIIAEVFAIPA